MRLGGILGVAGVVLSGCAPLPSNVEAPTPLRSKSIALVADACVIRDEIGDDYILHKATRELSRALKTAAEQELRQHGFTITASVAPFLCGAPLGDQKTFAIAETKGDDERQTKVPLPNEPSLKGRPELAAAYERLLAAVAAAPGTDYDAPKEPAKPVIEIQPADAALLRESLGTSLVWVAGARGGQVSFAKSFGTGMLTAAPGILLGAPVVSYWVLVDGVAYESAVVDLDRPAVQWKKTVALQRMDPASDTAIEAKWVAEPFKEFIAPAVEAPAAVAAAPSSEVAAAPADATIPAPAQATLPGAAPASGPAMLKLRARAAPDAEVVAEVPSESVTERGMTMQTPNGAWRFVRAGDKPGWVPAEYAPDPSVQAASGSAQVPNASQAK